MFSRKLWLTGADGSLGKYVTDRLIADGWEVHAAVHNTKTEEELFQNFHHHINHRVFPHRCDLTDPDSVERFFHSSGVADGLIHIAGGFVANSDFASTTAKDFDFIFRLNALSTMLLFKYAMPVLKMQNRGAIVTVGAKPALYPTASNAVYAASKAAVIALSRSAAEEGRSHNVRVNCIVPAIINTPSNMKWGSEEEAKKWTPPEDIADLITYLVSPKSSGITGSVIPMFGKLHT